MEAASEDGPPTAKVETAETVGAGRLHSFIIFFSSDLT